MRRRPPGRSGERDQREAAKDDDGDSSGETRERAASRAISLSLFFLTLSVSLSAHTSIVRASAELVLRSSCSPQSCLRLVARAPGTAHSRAAAVVVFVFLRALATGKNNGRRHRRRRRHGCCRGLTCRGSNCGPGGGQQLKRPFFVIFVLFLDLVDAMRFSVQKPTCSPVPLPTSSPCSSR